MYAEQDYACCPLQRPSLLYSFDVHVTLGHRAPGASSRERFASTCRPNYVAKPVVATCLLHLLALLDAHLLILQDACVAVASMLV